MGIRAAVDAEGPSSQAPVASSMPIPSPIAAIRPAMAGEVPDFGLRRDFRVRLAMSV
jgi:hypothetical protein